jgi:hypothetical protein
MVDLKKISDKLTHELNCLTDSQYSTINVDMKAMIIHTMDSARLTEIDFTLVTGSAREGVWTYYDSTKINVVKMTWDGYKLMFYYYPAPDESNPEILYNMTYDEFVSGGKKFVTLQRMHDIICEISYVLDLLSKQNKEVTVTLSNGVKVICNVPKYVTQEGNLVDYIKPQIEDFSKKFNEAIENGQYTCDDINGDKEV